MQYRIFDLETQCHVHFKRKASQFDDRNYIVAYGWQDRGQSSSSGIYCASADDARHSDWYIPDHINLLVGHNIKFDMLWVWEHASTKAFLKRGGKIWCTQLAEYLLEGHVQSAQMNALGDVALKYGGTSKYDPVKACWESGMLTSEIDEDILMDYLLGSDVAGDGDIGNTHKVFLGQLARAKKSNQYVMMQTRMESLLATTEMEYNGLKINKELGLQTARALEADIKQEKGVLQESLPELPVELCFNWGSGYHISALLFGGSIVYTKWVHHIDDDGNPLFVGKKVVKEVLDADGNPVRNKSGKNKGVIKTKIHTVPDLDKPKGAQREFLFKFDGFVPPREEWAGKRKLRCGTPVYSTDADTIKLVGTISNSTVPVAYAKLAKLSKDLETYYITVDDKGNEKGMLTYVNDENIIHHQLNHTSTKTSRMSASNPNMQNIPRGDTSDVKKMFISRFTNGVMCEIDFSQLEVVIQALLTGDKQMIADVNNGVDFHCKRLAVKLGEPYEHVWSMHHEQHDAEYGSMRTDTKGFSFQRAYGAGAQAIADSTGMEKHDVESLIEAEEILYPGITLFDNKVEAAINKSAQNMIRREQHPLIPNRYRAYALGEYYSPSNTRYLWRQWEAPDFVKRRGGADMCFSPTERKNWVVQGTGGEFMQLVLGKLFRFMLNIPRSMAVLVSTVHDCAWFDFATQEIADKLIPYINRIMVQIPHMLKELHNWDCPVRFTVEAECGPDMYNLVHHSSLTGGTSNDYVTGVTTTVNI